MSRAVTPKSVLARIDELRARKFTNRQIANRLNLDGIAPSMGGEWTKGKVQNLIYRVLVAPEMPLTREQSLQAWGRRPGFNDPYGVRNGKN
jgi:hypothetical protein